MQIFKYIFGERRYTARRVAGAIVLFIMLFATAAQGVKASARQAIQNGLQQENVVKLTWAMLQRKFKEQQILQIHALMLEAKNNSMPVQPLINKAFEGMAKGVDPSLILGAMETVQSPKTKPRQQISVSRFPRAWPPVCPRTMPIRSPK